jgi:hypothetical protein
MIALDMLAPGVGVRAKRVESNAGTAMAST